MDMRLRRTGIIRRWWFDVFGRSDISSASPWTFCANICTLKLLRWDVIFSTATYFLFESCNKRAGDYFWVVPALFVDKNVIVYLIRLISTEPSTVNLLSLTLIWQSTSPTRGTLLSFAILIPRRRRSPLIAPAKTVSLPSWLASLLPFSAFKIHYCPVKISGLDWKNRDLLYIKNAEILNI